MAVKVWLKCNIEYVRGAGGRRGGGWGAVKGWQRPTVVTSPGRGRDGGGPGTNPPEKRTQPPLKTCNNRYLMLWQTQPPEQITILFPAFISQNHLRLPLTSFNSWDLFYSQFCLSFLHRPCTCLTPAPDTQSTTTEWTNTNYEPG